MGKKRNPDLIDALRVTLRDIEVKDDLSPSDPDVRRLKRRILLKLADLERDKPTNVAAA